MLGNGVGGFGRLGDATILGGGGGATLGLMETQAGLVVVRVGSNWWWCLGGRCGSYGGY